MSVLVVASLKLVSWTKEPVGGAERKHSLSKAKLSKTERGQHVHGDLDLLGFTGARTSGQFHTMWVGQLHPVWAEQLHPVWVGQLHTATRQI